MICEACCSWNAPLNVPPVGLLEGKKTRVEGAQVLLTYEQNLFYYLHVVIHQQLNLLGLPT